MVRYVQIRSGESFLQKCHPFSEIWRRQYYDLGLQWHRRSLFMQGTHEKKSPNKLSNIFCICFKDLCQYLGIPILEIHFLITIVLHIFKLVFFSRFKFCTTAMLEFILCIINISWLLQCIFKKKN